MSVTGSRQGSFVKTNPSLETVICGFQKICQTLDKAPKQWWNQGQEAIAEEEEEDDNDPLNLSSMVNEEDMNNNDDNGSSSDEEMVTLQVGQEDNNDEEDLSPQKSNWLRDLDLDSDDGD